MTVEILVVDREAEVYAAAIRAAFPQAVVHEAAEAGAVTPGMRGAEVLVGLAPYLPASLTGAMPRLRLVHALTTGVDSLMGLPAPVLLTRTGGVHGPQMAELAVLMMLALLRDLPGMQADMAAGRWQRRPQPLLEGRVVCLLGLGAIAEALAVRAAAFGMVVTGVSDGRSAVPGFRRVYPRARLVEAAAEADVLVVIVPLSEATHHIVDARVLAALGPRGLLVNIARGGCVDEAALLQALESGGIAGAGLDVFETEPLPADHPFRRMPNVIATPHIGGMSDRYAAQAVPVMLRNLAAWVAGDPLPDLVNRGVAP